MDYQQQIILDNIQQYLIARDNSKLPLNAEDGICSGLVAYWLYHLRIGEEQLFKDEIEYALNWNLDQFNASSAVRDIILDELINNTLFLQNDYYLRNEVKQHEIDKSMSLLFPEHYPQVSPTEFSITFVFTKTQLAELINTVVMPNKMIRIGNGFHTLGLTYINGLYHYYDPKSCKGPTIIYSSAELATRIFDDLSSFCKSDSHLAINLSVFDLTTEVAAKYPNQIQYCNNFLLDQNNKLEILQHKNIFHLACQYEDYTILDLLFANGYTYVPWNLNKMPELNTAVTEKNASKLGYLIQHGIPLDYKVRFGCTPIGTAINSHADLMLYDLLIAGANPNIDPTFLFTPLQYAMHCNNSNAIMLLLAFELDFSATELERLKQKFSQPEINLIADHALQLNAKLLKISEPFNINIANNNALLNFLRNAKLKIKLGYAMDTITLIKDDKIYSGNKALKLINSANTEINSLLNFFRRPHRQHKQVHLVFAANFDTEITSRDFSQNALPLLNTIPHLN